MQRDRGGNTQGIECTGSLQGFVEHCVVFLRHHQALNKFSSSRTHLDVKLWTAGCRRSAIQRVCNILAPTKDTVVFIGDGFCNSWAATGVRRRAPVALRAVVQQLCRLVRVVIVNEYRTSKACCECKDVDAEMHPDSADWRLLRCDHCGHVTNRDRNGARNIEAVVLQWQLEGTRPRHLDGLSLRRFPSVGDPLCGYGSYEGEGSEDDDDDDDDV